MHCKLYLPNGWQTRITLHLANIKWITGLTTPPLSSLTLAVFWPNTCSNHFKVGTRFGTREWKAGTATRRKQSSRQRMYRLVRKKYDSFKLKIFINEKFWKMFHFFTCILPDYVAHDVMKSQNNFEKIAILKIWELFSFWGAKTHFGVEKAQFVIEILIHGSKSCLLDVLWSPKIIKISSRSMQTTFGENNYY